MRRPVDPPFPPAPPPRFSATATARVIARQNVAALERKEPKSLSAISKRASAIAASGLSALSVMTTIGVFFFRAASTSAMVNGE